MDIQGATSYSSPPRSVSSGLRGAVSLFRRSQRMSRWQGLQVKSEGTGISKPLSQQVNLLGEMLGQAIREQAGERVFSLVEELRLLCKRAANDDDPSARDQAEEIARGLAQDEIVWLLRAYNAFFHLVNQAEQQEIIRINRERARGTGGNASRPDS